MAKRVISAVLTLKDKDFSSGLKGAAAKTTDFERKIQYVGNSIQRFSQKAVSSFKAVGVGAAALGAAGLSALGVDVLGAAKEMDKAFAHLEARTGATGAELEGLEKIAKNVFKAGFGESLTNATEGVASLRGIFNDLSTNELQNVAMGASTIGELWGAETKEIGRTVKSMVDNFDGLSETKALDLMTFAFQKTGDYSDDLLDTFNEYSMHFSKLGLSAEDFTGILISGAQAGAWNMDKVGDAVKEFGIRAIDGSKGTKEAFKTIGLNAKEMSQKFTAGGDSANNAFAATIAGLSAMKDPVEQNAAGVALFGTMWEDLREDVILSMSGASKAVEGFEGSTAKAADKMHNNISDRVTNAYRNLKLGIVDLASDGAGKEFFDTLATKAEELVPKIEGAVQKAFEFGNTIKDNWGPIKETVIGVGTAVGALSVGIGALKVVGTVTKLVTGFRTALGLATAGQWAMNTAMLASPLTWVAVGIAGLVTAGVLLYRNWEKVSSIWDTVWSGIKSATASGINFVIDKINGLIGAINKIPGVNIPIIPHVEWGNVSRMPTQDNRVANGSTSEIKMLSSYDVGSNRIAQDHIAQVHKDEMIIPARQAERVRAAGGNIENIDKLVTAKGNNQSIVTTSTANTGGGGAIHVVIENITAKGVTVAEVVKEIVPQLKLALANM